MQVGGCAMPKKKPRRGFTDSARWLRLRPGACAPRSAPSRCSEHARPGCTGGVASRTSGVGERAKSYRRATAPFQSNLAGVPQKLPKMRDPRRSAKPPQEMPPRAESADQKTEPWPGRPVSIQRRTPLQRNRYFRQSRRPSPYIQGGQRKRTPSSMGS